MPELPEVETVVRGLRQPLIGRRVQSLWYDWARTLHSPEPQAFAERIRGQVFRAIDRRAKYIICALDHDYLIVHLKMTGRLYVAPAHTAYPADRWVHFRLGLDEGYELRFSDARKFGRVYLTDDPLTITGGLGPEPLSDAFTLTDFAAVLRGRARALKPLLLDQTVIAGVGNIYADEALFRARLHPLRLASTLSEGEIAALYQSVRDALSDGIRHEGASINWYRKPDGTAGESQNHFFAYDRGGEPCHVCGTPIIKMRVAQRGTHYCPTCQPLPVETVTDSGA